MPTVWDWVQEVRSLRELGADCIVMSQAEWAGLCSRVTPPFPEWPARLLGMEVVLTP